jgi:ATP-binding cassette subfamily F protein uup
MDLTSLDTGQVILRKSICMAFISNNNLQDELTIEESISHQIMKLLKSQPHESARESRRRGSLPKAFDGMDQHNAWDFETQYSNFSN